MSNLSEIKQKLQEELEKLLHDLEELEKAKEDVFELSVKELSEAASRYEGQESYHIFKEKLTRRIEQLRRALEKIVENSYGVCDSCKKEIERQRLDIDPASNLCSQCSKKRLI